MEKSNHLQGNMQCPNHSLNLVYHKHSLFPNFVSAQTESSHQNHTQTNEIMLVSEKVKKFTLKLSQFCNNCQENTY